MTNIKPKLPMYHGIWNPLPFSLFSLIRCVEMWIVVQCLIYICMCVREAVFASMYFILHHFSFSFCRLFSNLTLNRIFAIQNIPFVKTKIMLSSRCLCRGDFMKNRYGYNWWKRLKCWRIAPPFWRIRF